MFATFAPLLTPLSEPARLALGFLSHQANPFQASIGPTVHSAARWHNRRTLRYPLTLRSPPPTIARYTTSTDLTCLGDLAAPLERLEEGRRAPAWRHRPRPRARSRRRPAASRERGAPRRGSRHAGLAWPVSGERPATCDGAPAT